MGIFSEMDIELKSGTEETALDAAEDTDILAKAQERDDARQQVEGEKAKTVLEQLTQTEPKAEAKKAAEVCHPNKNGHRKASKNGMNRILSFVFERRPHLFHGSLDNEPLPT